MGMALGRLAQEDPTFKVHTDPDSGTDHHQRHGELHLEIIVDRMMREYKVEANVGKPQVAYRETIRKKTEAEASTSGRPAARVNTVTSSCVSNHRNRARVTSLSTTSLAGRFRKSSLSRSTRELKKLSKAVFSRAIRCGCQGDRVRRELHDVDSNEMAFKIAGSMAFKEAARKASPVRSSR